eukprot:6179418-Pleurochrysis_carterae.AAC.3
MSTRGAESDPHETARSLEGEECYAATNTHPRRQSLARSRIPAYEFQQNVDVTKCSHVMREWVGSEKD